MTRRGDDKGRLIEAQILKVPPLLPGGRKLTRSVDASRAAAGIYTYKGEGWQRVERYFPCLKRRDVYQVIECYGLHDLEPLSVDLLVAQDFWE